MIADTDYARWLREFKRYLPLKTLFILHGNIYDMLPYPVFSNDEPNWTYLTLRHLLHRFLKDHKYKSVVFYDPVDGFNFNSIEEKKIFQAGGKSGSARSRDSHDHSDQPDRESGASAGMSQLGIPQLRDFDAALDVLREVMVKSNESMAFVIDYASRLVSSPGHLQQAERRQFIKLLKCLQEAAVKVPGKLTSNVMVLICDRLTDLPTWLYLQHPLVKTLQIELPDQLERRRYFESSIDGFFNSQDSDEDNNDGINKDNEIAISTFIDLTRSLTNYELECLRQVSLLEKISFYRPKKIIEHYKFGIVESDWDLLDKKEGRDRLVRADQILGKRVKGQEAAIKAVVDIIKRAAVGLSGTQHSAAAHKPKGILFFAGPTGVGKTEMARSLAELLFNDENACIRFDMSEYAQEHSDQKLLGAPPGYIGYEEGGQLTNKVRESPFAVLLFDEIEKAHDKIMDKFLQILEDGRMTDGKGETVYFSEAVIIFTSNIGAYIDMPQSDGTIVRKANILPYSWCCQGCTRLYTENNKPNACNCGQANFKQVETPYRFVKEKVLKAIEEHFKLKLGRPEIYNRIGNNFVVFDYIRPPVVRQIIDKMLENISKELDDKRRISVKFDTPVLQYLEGKAAGDIEQGGRGIGNLVETTLLNPLARYIFDRHLKDTELLVKQINEEEIEGRVFYHLEVSL